MSKYKLSLKQLVPSIDWVSRYKKRALKTDLFAGLTVSIMLIPQGMAYAYLAGLPPIYGLYGGLFPLLVYALLGTSRHLSVGPVAVTSLLVIAGIGGLAEPMTPEYIELVLICGLMVGVFQIIMAILRLGFSINFLSHPVIAGFTSAAAVIVSINQLKDILGFSIPRLKHTYQTLFYAVENISQTNLITISMVAVSVTICLILKKINRAIPGMLIVVIIGTIATWFWGLNNLGVDIVKDIPQGLPAFKTYSFDLETFRLLLPVAITITLICMVESIGIGKAIEAKHNFYKVRPNQELLALGLAKAIGAFFQAMPSSGSFGRSALNHEMKARTPLSSLIAAGVIALTLFVFTPALYFLPKCILASIIVLAVISLFDLKEALYLYKTHRRDFWNMTITFFVTLVIGIEEGVLTGVALSIIKMLMRSARPHIAILGKVPGTSIYRNISRYDDVEQIENILVLRFDDQLYFGNVAHFKESIKDLINESGHRYKFMLIDASGIHDIDSEGVRALKEINYFLSKQKIKLGISGVIGPVRDMLYQSGFNDVIGKSNYFLHIDDAINYYQGKVSHVKEYIQRATQTNMPPLGTER